MVTLKTQVTEEERKSAVDPLLSGGGCKRVNTYNMMWTSVICQFDKRSDPYYKCIFIDVFGKAFHIRNGVFSSKNFLKLSWP